MRPQEGDDDLPTITTLLTTQFVPDGANRKIIAQMRAQFRQREPRAVAAFAAISAVVVRIIDMSEAGGFQSGEFHRRSLPPQGCESLLYNSYSVDAS